METINLAASETEQLPSLLVKGSDFNEPASMVLSGWTVVVDLSRNSVGQVDVDGLSPHRVKAAASDVLALVLAPPEARVTDGAIQELANWNQPILAFENSQGVKALDEASVVLLLEAGVSVIVGIDVTKAGSLQNGDWLVVTPAGHTNEQSVPCRAFAIRGGRIPWFEVEEVAEGVFSLAEPGHREYVRSYLVTGDREAALIDTGAGIEDIRAEVERLTDLPVRVVLTHTHWDHIGSAYRFEQVALYDHPGERERLAKGYPMGSEGLSDLKSVQLRRKLFGRPWPPYFDPQSYEIPGVQSVETLTHDEVIDLGNRNLRVLHTPGHSPGSISLLDELNRLLFVGDAFYWGPLFGQPQEFDFEAYRMSARRLADLANAVDQVFPGHNELTLNGRLMTGQDLVALREGFERIAEGKVARRVRHLYEYGPGWFSVEVPPPE